MVHYDIAGKDPLAVLICLFVVVLCNSDSISDTSWQRFDVSDEKEKDQSYTCTDSRDR